MSSRSARLARTLLFAVVAVSSSTHARGQATPPALPAPPTAAVLHAGEAQAGRLSPDQQEIFLSTAKILKTRNVSKGITGTRRATLTDGIITHDASIQTIDESRWEYRTALRTEFNFRDTWMYNVAAYRVAKLLGLAMVPPSVERQWEGTDASFTWWVDDVIMDDKERIERKIAPPSVLDFNLQIYVMRVFDQLIENTDRNLTNILITRDWRVWLIDHSRAFRNNPTLRSPASLVRCDRGLLERLRALDAPTLERSTRPYLGPREIKALLARRDLLVAHFDAAGPGALFDLPPR